MIANIYNILTYNNGFNICQIRNQKEPQVNLVFY